MMTPTQVTKMAQTLKSNRERLGLTAAEVARRAHVNIGTVTRIEHGQITSPRTENLLAIAAVLEIPAADVFAMTNLLQTNQLPSFTPYLRAKYQYLPESAIAEMQRVFDDIASRVGRQGPRPGEDE